MTEWWLNIDREALKAAVDKAARNRRLVMIGGTPENGIAGARRIASDCLEAVGFECLEVSCTESAGGPINLVLAVARELKQLGPDSIPTNMLKLGWSDFDEAVNEVVELVPDNAPNVAFVVDGIDVGEPLSRSDLADLKHFSMRLNMPFVVISRRDPDQWRAPANTERLVLDAFSRDDVVECLKTHGRQHLLSQDPAEIDRIAALAEAETGGLPIAPRTAYTVLSRETANAG